MELSSCFHFRSINYKLFADHQMDKTKAISDTTVFQLINNKKICIILML